MPTSKDPPYPERPVAEPWHESCCLPDFGAYMSSLERQIKRCWFVNRDGVALIVVVTFKIHRSGTVSDLRIYRSAGSISADKAGLDAVQNAQPFRPLPEGSPESVDIQFTFDYNAWSRRDF